MADNLPPSSVDASGEPKGWGVQSLPEIMKF
jgi:hypothetical protein